MNKVLIIDDDIELAQMLSEYLQQNGIENFVINNPVDALNHLKTHEYSLVLLDVMMPQMDGFEVLKELRVSNDVPVIMLTAKGEHFDKVLGLELGADDYLAKPFNHRELLARIKANTRRFDAANGIKRDKDIHSGNIVLSVAKQSVRVAQKELELTATEFQLLHLLMKNKGDMLSKDELCQAALGRRISAYDRSLDMHISNVRKKLAAEGEEQRIKTIRGSGYLFISETE